MEGTKRYEFRRKAPARDIDGLYVHIAGTGPYAQAYVGVNCVHTGTPEAIWEYCSECAAIMPPGISREDFFAYFEDRTTVWCRRCGQSFDVYREWVAYYTNVEPDPCSMCPGSESTERFRDGWRCRIGGCATMKED